MPSYVLNMRLLTLLVMCLSVPCLPVTFASTLDENSTNFLDYPTGVERKQAFIKHLKPFIDKINRSLLNDRAKLIRLSHKQKLNIREQRWLRHISYLYSNKTYHEDRDFNWSGLLRKIDIIPASLALAQAAKESGWGTSRFARSGNNYFGQWCYVKGCGLVPKKRNQNANHEVASYDSIEDSIAAYMYNLNTHPAYKDLRETRWQLRKIDKAITGHQLANGLQSYSERGKIYVEEIQSLIRFNKLDDLESTI